MADIVVKVESVGKKYRLGSIGTGTLSHDLNLWWAKFRGKENTFSKVNKEKSNTYNNQEFWALKEIDFEVRQGDAHAIIGKNGAGKSTLLKILSKVTSPTTGQVKIRGRVASLLEVGTGFHPELTGRENIFLNGAILGMTKREISEKLDEIIAFSGVEIHIDTPVKRYSSGMHVRLAFAVAAHLEPEILIVDEVLAVGDAEFQKKCLGKMNLVTGEGRTVLFVSHNLGAVQSLCKSGLMLHEGKKVFEGSAEETILNYSKIIFHNKNAEISWTNINDAPGSHDVKIIGVRVLNKTLKICNILPDNEEFYLEIDFLNHKDGIYLTSSIQLLNKTGLLVLCSGNWASTISNFDPYSNSPFPKGFFSSRVKIPGFFLNEGGYTINAVIDRDASTTVAFLEHAISFTIIDTGEMKKEYTGNFSGAVRPKFEWNTNFIKE